MKMHNLHHLTGIRGLAAFIVVFYHIEAYIAPYFNQKLFTIIQHGYLAVDFFFILSGFVIAFNYFDRLVIPNKTKIYHFYLKRVARIYPLHLLLLLAYLSVPIVYIFFGKDLSTISGGNKFSIDGFVFSLFLMQSWGIVENLTWNVPSWSISTEMMAYLLFPLMVTLLTYICKKWHALGAVSALLIACFIIIFIFKGTASIGDNIQALGVLRCVLEFFCGVCVWSLTKCQWKNFYGIVMFYGGIIVFSLLMTTTIDDYYFVPLTMSMVILGSVIHKSPINNFFGNRSLIWLGNISYSVYLSHYFIRDWFKLLFLDTNEASILWIVSYVVSVLIISHFLYTYYEMAAKNKVLSVFHDLGPRRLVTKSSEK